MSNFTQEPRNWRNVAKVEHRGVTGCAVIIPQSDEKNIEVFYGCEQICSECKMCGANPNRAAYIQSCKDRLQKEEGAMEEKKPYDLTREGPVLSLEPVVVECSMSDAYVGRAGYLVFVGRGINKYLVYHKDNPSADNTLWWKSVRHITPKRTRDMTADEIAMLPRGTAFIGNDAAEMFCATITAHAEDYGAITIDGYMISEYAGYRLPGETEIRNFEVEI